MRTKVGIKKAILIDFLIINYSIPKDKMDEFSEKYNKASLFDVQKEAKEAFNKNREYGAFKLGSVVFDYFAKSNKNQEKIYLISEALYEIFDLFEFNRNQS